MLILVKIGFKMNNFLLIWIFKVEIRRKEKLEDEIRRKKTLEDRFIRQ